MDTNTRWQILMAEALGTFFLVFVGVGSVPATFMLSQNNKAPFSMADLGVISWAFGTIVVVTVYVFGYISGNHINPAVTLGLAVGGLFPWKRVPEYIVAQLVGAFIGGFAIVGVLGSIATDFPVSGVGGYGDIPWLQAGLAEFIGTAMLVYTVFAVVYRKAEAGWAGMAIGLVVFAVIIPIAPITGAYINPARYIGPLFVQAIYGHGIPWDQVAVYVISEMLAGVVAAVVWAAITKTKADRQPAGVEA
jgi:glycerol uptake facilitator protein